MMSREISTIVFMKRNVNGQVWEKRVTLFGHYDPFSKERVETFVGLA
jgi:hypothetical protein